MVFSVFIVSLWSIRIGSTELLRLMQAEAPAGGRPRTHHFIGRNFAPMNQIGEPGQIDERGISERTRAVFGCFELPFDAEPSWYSRADRLLGAFWVQFSWPFF